MNKLDITISECRQMYAKLIQDTNDVFKASVSSSETGMPYSSADLDDTWSAVEKEMKNVYEMSRFGLNITDLANMHNIDQFRGFCEDVDGIEPRNDELLFKITRNVAEIDESLGSIASNRALVPETLERELNSYVDKKRALYTEFLANAGSSTPQLNEGNEFVEENVLESLPKADEVLNLVSETSKRLLHSQRVLESIIEKTRESS